MQVLLKKNKKQKEITNILGSFTQLEILRIIKNFCTFAEKGVLSVFLVIFIFIFFFKIRSLLFLVL